MLRTRRDLLPRNLISWHLDQRIRGPIPCHRAWRPHVRELLPPLPPPLHSKLLRQGGAAAAAAGLLRPRPVTFDRCPLRPQRWASRRICMRHSLHAFVLWSKRPLGRKVRSSLCLLFVWECGSGSVFFRLRLLTRCMSFAGNCKGDPDVGSRATRCAVRA